MGFSRNEMLPLYNGAMGIKNGDYVVTCVEFKRIPTSRPPCDYGWIDILFPSTFSIQPQLNEQTWKLEMFERDSNYYGSFHIVCLDMCGMNL